MAALIPCNSADSTKVYLPNLESATLHLPKTKGSDPFVFVMVQTHNKFNRQAFLNFIFFEE
ncbi:hypothetical protein [Lactococcus lactis]|uniref:Uncharacterized protein n=1 Tax=Lactococcus cremoris subsp. cremoris GE214 TaxID=1415168 RepID=A0A084A8S7_LACLC|nr:hypothetical protein U725_02148 [Lactococcus cremoris subsp. cremoris GE214]